MFALPGANYANQWTYLFRSLRDNVRAYGLDAESALLLSSPDYFYVQDAKNSSGVGGFPLDEQK